MDFWYVLEHISGGKTHCNDRVFTKKLYGCCNSKCQILQVFNFKCIKISPIILFSRNGLGLGVIN